MEKPFWSHVVLAPGCGRLLHTTAGQLGRPAVAGAISRRGGPLRHTLSLRGKSMHQVVQVADQAPCYVKRKSAAPCGVTARGSSADTV